MSDLTTAIQAATETAAFHGIIPDRQDILQDGNTLVMRLTETLVARVVRDPGGPRQGTDWFRRESAVACYLATAGAPVIPMHPDIPPGPHEHLGHTLNFWRYVEKIEKTPDPAEIGKTLHRCHALLADFPGPLPELAILTESLHLLDPLEERREFSGEDVRLLRDRLEASISALGNHAAQPLHGDAHMGNLFNTTEGLLWTDWEDTFSGPVEWDLASIIWNARILDGEQAFADSILEAYVSAGGHYETAALDQCLVARAAVMSAWYPVLYPQPSPERAAKLRMRLDWLRRNG